MEHGKRISPCVWTAITRILYHAARSSSTAVCPASISGIKISAYFSIISARKPAKALHSSELDVQAETGKRSFSLAGYFFNRQLHFLVAEQRVPAILSNFPSNLIVQTIFYHLKIPAGTVNKNQQLLIVLWFGKNIGVFTKTHFPPPDKILLRSLNLAHHGFAICQTARWIEALDGILEILFFFLVESFLMSLNVLLEGRYKLIVLWGRRMRME